MYSAPSHNWFLILLLIGGKNGVTFLQPIRKRSKANPEQTRITFYTQLKTALKCFIDSFTEFLSYGFGHPSYCGADCKFLSDGFGYWINDTWIAHAPGKVCIFCVICGEELKAPGKPSQTSSLEEGVRLAVSSHFNDFPGLQKTFSVYNCDGVLRCGQMFDSLANPTNKSWHKR